MVKSRRNADGIAALQCYTPPQAGRAGASFITIGETEQGGKRRRQEERIDAALRRIIERKFCLGTQCLHHHIVRQNNALPPLRALYESIYELIITLNNLLAKLVGQAVEFIAHPPLFVVAVETQNGCRANPLFLKVQLHHPRICSGCQDRYQGCNSCLKHSLTMLR